MLSRIALPGVAREVVWSPFATDQADSDSKDVICPSFIVKRVIYNTWSLFKWLICVMHCHYNPFK